MNDQAKSNPETDTMSPEDMAHYLMDGQIKLCLWKLAL